MQTLERIYGASMNFALALSLAGCEGDSSSDEPTSGSLADGESMSESECEVDEWEPNFSPQKPSIVTWQYADEWVANRQIEDAFLCAGEDDWYHFDVASLNFQMHYVYVRALVEDAGLCGADCDQPVIAAGPQHAMTIEIYNAADMKLLGSTTQEDGVMVINGSGGDEYAHELLIHVFGPTPKAEYRYRLSVEVRNYDGEDECEC